MQSRADRITRARRSGRSLASTRQIHGIDLLNAVAAHCYASDAVCPQVGASASHGQLAVVLDNHVVTAPTIDAPSFTMDEIGISGAFDEASADTLTAILNSGPLPAAVTATSG